VPEAAPMERVGVDAEKHEEDILLVHNDADGDRWHVMVLGVHADPALPDCVPPDSATVAENVFTDLVWPVVDPSDAEDVRVRL